MRARKVDLVQQDIVDALRRSGALVWVINGAIDLLVQWRDKLVLIDSKSRGGRQTATQRGMVAQGWVIHFCETPLQAYEAVGIPPRMRR
jgi:hypothetical protein